jgi:hypothetical protein
MERPVPVDSEKEVEGIVFPRKMRRSGTHTQILII